jgi:hypothetical protein
MNTEKLLRLLFPKTIQKIENDMATKAYNIAYGYPENEPEYDYDYHYENDYEDDYEYTEEYEAMQAEIMRQEMFLDEYYSMKDSNKEPEAFVPPCSIGDYVHLINRYGKYEVIDLNDKTFTITCKSWQRKKPKLYQTEEIEWSEFKNLAFNYEFKQPN